MPSIYPALVGQGYSFVKRPIWNTSIGAAASGRETRAALQVYPIYEFDLTYDFLSDGLEGIVSTNASDFKAFLGFYNAMAGGCYAFLFLDPDDNSVTGQALGTGDGSTKAFTFARTLGGAAGSTTEPVGYVSTSAALNVYVNGVLQASSAYTITRTSYYGQTVTFTTAPASAAVITADFSFYYAVRFKDDQYDFEKPMSQLWMLKKVTLRTVRS